MAKGEKLGGKDGCGAMYPGASGEKGSAADLAWQPGADKDGVGAKDGCGNIYPIGSSISGEYQPPVMDKGVGGKSRGSLPPGSLKRMGDDADGYTTEDRRFRGGKG